MTYSVFRPCLGLSIALTCSAGAANAQRAENIRSVDVFLNEKFLVAAHAHVRSGDARIHVDQGCIEHNEIARLLGGQQFLAQRGQNLDAVRLGGARGATLRVLRRGRISARLHRTGGKLYIPLLDFVRALGASIAADRSDRIGLTLEGSPADAILALNESPRRP